MCLLNSLPRFILFLSCTSVAQWQSSYRRLFCIFRSLLPQFLQFIKREGSIWALILCLNCPLASACMHAFPITSERCTRTDSKDTTCIINNGCFYHIPSAFLCEEGRKKKKHRGRKETKIKKTSSSILLVPSTLSALYLKLGLSVQIFFNPFL